MPTDYLMNTEVRESLLILLNITLKPDNNIFWKVSALSIVTIAVCSQLI